MTQNELNNKISSFLQSAIERLVVNDYNEAIRTLKAAEVLDKNNPEILYNLGISYAKLGLHKTAIEYYNKTLNLPSTYVGVLTVKKLITYSYINMNDYTAATQMLEQVFSDTESDITALSMRGYCFEKQNKFHEAIKTYKQIISIDRQNYNAYNSLAYIIGLTDGDIDTALKYSNVAYKSDKNNAAYLDTIGYLYFKRGDIKKARQFLNKAIIVNPLSNEIKEHIALLPNE